MNDPDHIFAVKNWARTRGVFRRMRAPWTGCGDVGEINLMIYLTEVYSWMMERKENTHAR